MRKAFRIMGIVTMAGIISIMSCASAFGAVQTAAYKTLKSQIAEEDPVSANYYAAYDKNGNDWHGVFDNKGKMLALVSTVYDRGDAEVIADTFGKKLYYKVPMSKRQGADFYQVIVPVYENTESAVLCARPEEMYKDGYKVIDSRSFTKDGQVLVIRTNLTPSYKVRLSTGSETAYICWSNDWYPEEESQLPSP